VGQKKPNAWGLFDMLGNVWEWCEDVHHGSYGGAPVDGTAWLRDGTPPLRLLRGGSWYAAPTNCRSADRGRASTPNANYFGCRVVLRAF